MKYVICIYYLNRGVVMKLKKISLTADYLNALANANLGTYHYKVLLLLETKAMTQAQVSEILKIKKQNINKYVSDLKKMGLLEVDRIEGRNQFLRATNSFLPQENQDQMTFDDI